MSHGGGIGDGRYVETRARLAVARIVARIAGPFGCARPYRRCVVAELGYRLKASSPYQGIESQLSGMASRCLVMRRPGTAVKRLCLRHARRPTTRRSIAAGRRLLMA